MRKEYPSVCVEDNGIEVEATGSYKVRGMGNTWSKQLCMVGGYVTVCRQDVRPRIENQGPDFKGLT